MFKNDPQSSSYIPCQSVQVFPEAQVEYNPTNQTQARFLLPQFLGYFDPRETRMQFNLKMQGRGRPQPSSRAGAHSLIRDVRIQDGTGSTNLTEILDYNVLTAQHWHYTSNDSINDKRTLFEGLSNNPTGGQSTYWSGAENWDQQPITETNGSTATNLQIQMPLHDGIMDGEKVFPVGATQGLRIQMTLDNVSRSCNYQQGEKGIGFANGVDLAVQLLIDTEPKLALDTTAVIQIVLGGGPSQVDATTTPYNNNPFSVGDVLYVEDAVGGNVEELGVVQSYTTSTPGAPGGEIQYNVVRNVAIGAAGPPVIGGWGATHAVGSKVYVKNTDRLSGWTNPTPAFVPATLNALAAVGVSYALTNLEYLVGSVSPPEAYSAAMMNQINSGKGLACDFKTYSTYRVNLTATIGLTNQLIPATARRAYSVLSVPLSNAAQIDLAADSLGGIIDHCQNYQYVHGNSLIPDRPVPLGRYNNTPPHVDALHVIELEKALLNCGFATRNLQRLPQHFLMGRSFSKYGQVADLWGEDLSMRVEYSGEATETKIYNHYLCHLRRMTIVQGRVTAE